MARILTGELAGGEVLGLHEEAYRLMSHRSKVFKCHHRCRFRSEDQ